nr:FecR family protein [Pedobacter panaciterrae]
MDSSKFNKLLGRYLKGDANETENALINAWYKSYNSNEELVRIDEIESENSKKIVRKRLIIAIKPTERTNIKRIRQLSIAASVLICFTLGLLYYNQLPKSNGLLSYSEISTGIGRIKKVTLPDNSVVWINAATKIRVPSNYTGKVREVYLDEGEAFFKVTKNPNRPFIVHTGKINIRVLGTSFNVRSYPTIAEQKVQVATGLVQVSNKNKTLGLLKHGQQLTYNTLNNNITVDSINTERMTWNNGNVYMEQISFSELALILHNTYGLNLKAGSKKVDAYHFTLKLSHSQPIESILKAISMIHNTNYRKEGNDIIIY